MMNTKTFAGFTARIILLPAILSYGCSKDIEQPDEENYEEIPEAVITDFQPKTGSTDNIVTITGENFGTDMANVRVTFGNKNVDKIEELSDTKIVVKVPLVEVSEDTDIPVSVTVGDASKTFTEKFSYIYVPYTWIWISGSFNNWSTDTAMEKDPVDPYTFHYTSDIIPATPDENGERAFKFLTKSVSWPWANTYNAAQEKAPITDTRVLFQANAGEEGKDWKWEFETWQCGYAYEFTLSIKPGEEKMTCTPVDGTPVPPKTYSTVSTLKTSVNLSDFRTMGFTSDGKLIAIAGWVNINDACDPAGLFLIAERLGEHHVAVRQCGDKQLAMLNAAVAVDPWQEITGKVDFHALTGHSLNIAAHTYKSVIESPLGKTSAKG